MSDNQELIISETRVKKYKKYRRNIKSDFLTYEKKNSKNDEIKEIEKMISKIDKNLIMHNKSDDIFYVDFTNIWTEADRTIIPAKQFLENIRNCNFTDLLNKASMVKNDVNFEPHFDLYGNMSSVWLDDDSKYSDLVELKNWITTMIDNKEVIINNTKENIFTFKDAFYKAIDPENVKQILPIKTIQPTYKANKINKKLLWFFIVFFFVFASLGIIFLFIHGFTIIK